MPYQPTEADLAPYRPQGYQPSQADLAPYRPSLLFGHGLGTDLEHIPQDIAGGLGQIGLTAAHAVAPEASGYLSGLGVTPQAMGPSDPNTLDKIIQSSVAYAPYSAAGGEAGPLIEPLISGAAGKAAPFLSRMLGQSGGGAAFGSQQPGATGKSIAESALLGGAGEAAGAGVAQAPTALRAGFRRAVGGIGKAGEITPEEVRANMALTPEGVKMPLGAVANSPRLQNMYGVASAVIGSGAAQPFNKLKQIFSAKLGHLTEGAPDNISDPEQHIYDDVKEAYAGKAGMKANTKAKYNTLEKVAAASNAPFDRSPLDSAIQEEKSKIQPLMGIDPETDKLYQPALDSLNNYQNAKLPDFSSAFNARKSLNSLISKEGHPLSGDKFKQGVLLSMKDGLDKSTELSAGPHPEVHEAFMSANQARIDQGKFETNPSTGGLSPFARAYNAEKKAGAAFHPDNFLNSYLKPSRGLRDNSGLTEALTSKLTPSARELAAETYLKAGGDSVGKQVGQLNALNPMQRQSLFAEKAPDAQNIADMSKLYPEGKEAGWVPKTGLTGSKGLQAAGFGGSVATGVGAALMGHPGILAPALTAAGGAVGGAHLIQRMLRSHMLKNYYLRSLEGTPGMSDALLRHAPIATRGATGATIQSLLGGQQNG